MRQLPVNQTSLHSFPLGASGGLFSSYRQAWQKAKVTGIAFLHSSSQTVGFLDSKNPKINLSDFNMWINWPDPLLLLPVKLSVFRGHV